MFLIQSPINFRKDWNLHRTMWGVLVILLLIGCRSKIHTIPDIETQLERNKRQDYVVLLHGMWRNARAMEPAREYLSAKGYQVINISYPSTQYPIEILVQQYLHPVIEQIQPNGKQKIHFVTHSMGGILVRYYLKHYQVPELGRVVMLSPPNQGVELTDWVSGTDWFEEMTGPSGQQLRTDETSLVKQLGAVDFELGVIAGDYNPNWITSWLIPGPDDGVVSVKSTKVEGMKDFILVSERHYRLRRRKPVLQQVVYFLQHGQFLHFSG